MKAVNRVTHKIDASGKIAGRLATTVASLLIGKHKATFEPNIDAGDFVIISNVKDLLFSGKKMAQKFYYRASGHPGGLKKTSLAKKMADNPAQLFKEIVKTMLPKNRLQTDRIKRLTFKD
jgi:large subunit ribosomal protein L13